MKCHISPERILNLTQHGIDLCTCFQSTCPFICHLQQICTEISVFFLLQSDQLSPIKTFYQDPDYVIWKLCDLFYNSYRSNGIELLLRMGCF